MSTSREQERVAECQRLIEELGSFTEELTAWEKNFVEDLDKKITQYGLATYISFPQFEKLSEVYRRVVER